MALGIAVADFTEILTDLGVSVSYYACTRTIDPIYGSESTSLAAAASKTWIFFKRMSDLELKKWGITDTGEAYVIMPTTDTLYYGDRVAYAGETFEYTPTCKTANRYANGTNMYKYYTLKKVA